MNTKETMDSDTLELPFYDDFANSVVFPSSDLWIDKNAFINDGYAKDPISIGVATLDVLDSVGAVYSFLSSTVSSAAECLTSRPINLNYTAADSVYLSFYYQCGGYGNKPDVGDSLVLEFTTPDTTWTSVWQADGGVAMDSFRLVLIPITQEWLLKKGFQFRFKNHASISSNYEPSWISNADCWNIDYIRLDTARNQNDTITQDVAFISYFSSMIKDFESAPWNHFEPIASLNTIDSLVYVYKNNGPTTQNINRQLLIKDVWGNGTGFSNLDDSENILPFSTLSYAKNVNYTFNSGTVDSARFELKGFIKTDTTLARRPFRWNDTICYYQTFYNYYSYDDGSAEKGYGITGQGTTGSAVALQFTPLQNDTLRGAYIFFNQVLDEGNIHYFFFTVWDDEEGVPGDTLAKQLGVRPVYSDSINEFVYYALDTPLLITGTFYIGWIKTTDDMLNVGFDVNRDASQHLFYNTQGDWISSSLPGAIMVRPVFGVNPDPSWVKPQNTDNYTLFPNPATNAISIRNTNGQSPDKCAIYDISGRLCLESYNTEFVNIHSLPEGLYFIRFADRGNIRTLKFVVSR